MTQQSLLFCPYCNDDSSAFNLSPEQMQAACALFGLGFTANEIIESLQNHCELDAAAVHGLEYLVRLLSTEIYTKQLQTITELNKRKLSGYKIATELKSRFGRHSLSQKTVYNYISRLNAGEKCDPRLAVASFCGARKRKTRH